MRDFVDSFTIQSGHSNVEINPNIPATVLSITIASIFSFHLLALARIVSKRKDFAAPHPGNELI